MNELSVFSFDQRIEFLLWFAQIDLDTLRPWGWLKLRDDSQRFLRVDRVSHGDLFIEGVLPEHHQSDLIAEGLSLEEYPEEAFRALQIDVKNLLHQLAIGAIDGSVTFSKYVPVSVNLRLVRVQTGPDNHCVSLGTSGPVRDTFLLMAMLLLTRQPFRPIARCPECGKIFHRRDKRQQFCERRCANLAASKRFQKRKKAKKGRKK